ncbi:MAG: hypothetical protein EOP84_31715 [Verrucomicrobiaceae bacterium]|nr:MAG: hypothetical protein EOP84_31715 [Verrucomicrobiaceae bacterium]
MALPLRHGGRRVCLPDVPPLERYQGPAVPHGDVGNAAVMPLQEMAGVGVYPAAGGGQHR